MKTKKHGPNWKGDKVGYGGVHQWLYKVKGRPIKCEHCGTIVGKFEWANINHSYKRTTEDYIGLCISCHRKFDVTDEARKKCLLLGLVVLRLVVRSKKA